MICSQVALAILDSLRESFDDSTALQRDASLSNNDASAITSTGDAFDISNFVRDVDNVGISSKVDSETTSIFEERHDCDENEKCDVSLMSTTSDGDDGSSLSETGESVRFVSKYSHDLNTIGQTNGIHRQSPIYSSVTKKLF